MEIHSLEGIIQHFGNARVLVIGDLMLDTFVRGHVARISDEAPVPAVEITTESIRPGGAANAMANIRALGGRVIAAGAVGGDPAGSRLTAFLQESGVDTSGILVCDDRPTTQNTRIIAERNQQPILHLEKENTEEIPPALADRVMAFVTQRLGEADAVLISDYDKGFVTGSLLDTLIPVLRKSGKPVVVDTHVRHFHEYHDVTLVKVTLQVAGEITGVRQINVTSLRNIGQHMLTQLESQYVLITRGKDGMCLFEREGTVSHIPSVAEEVKEPAGVADTVAAVAALSLAVDPARVQEAAILSNTAAGIVVGKLGSGTVTADELLRFLRALRGRQLIHDLTR